MSWNWWVDQVFAFVGLIFIIISYQQKTTFKLILYRNFATISVLVGLFFLGQVSAIIMLGAGVIRNAVGLYFAVKPNTRKSIKIVSGSLIALLLIILNIIFWENYYNIFSIVVGIGLIITFLQENPKTIRILTVFVQILAVTYFSLLLSPTNIIIEAFALVSAIVGIIRLDIRKKEDNSKSST